jgi:hypothetical protein
MMVLDINCQDIINHLRTNSKLYDIPRIITLLKNNLHNRTVLILKNTTLQELITLCQNIDKIKIYGFGSFLLIRSIYGIIY